MSKIAEAMLQITNENQSIIAGMTRVLDSACIPPAARMLIEKTIAQLRDLTAKAMIADHLEAQYGLRLIRRAASEPSEEYLLKVVDAAIDTPIAKKLDAIRINLAAAQKRGDTQRVRIAKEQKDAVMSVRPVSNFIRAAVTRRRKAYDAFRVRYYGEAAFVPPSSIGLTAAFQSEANPYDDEDDYVEDDDFEEDAKTDEHGRFDD